MPVEPTGAALVAEFDAAAALIAATRRLVDAGYVHVEAYAPVYLEGLITALPEPPTRRRIPALALLGGLLGGGLMFGFQGWASAVDWELNVGGRPEFSWPAFIIPSFECVILAASLTVFLAALALGDMPRPHHPIFALPGFERASDDRFFLSVGVEDPRFDPVRTRELLEDLEPLVIHELHV
ncbi:DUF3341 domain-containing protein [Enhygromyxa salina]|uniref:DUF3341 domain-containing protein n=1 Tax=Enhygromyxa salina TaxID=215803 RepID=A0A2S9YP90_9BACT|nr:DUF3341 domain-containing protein [Enhygromyxa salina]PRQ06915.1 hypothetical protein ENSA7_33390 [Enhygromyxa salina]